MTDLRPPPASLSSGVSSPQQFLRRSVAVYLPALIGGGAERVAAVLASNLNRAGHDVTLVVDFDAPHNADFVDAGVKRVTLAGAHGHDVLRLADFIKQRQPEIVLAIGAASNVKLVLAHMLARLTARIRTRVVLSYHGPSDFGTGWLGWSAYPLAALLTRYASRTVCVSDELVRHLLERWNASRERVVRIYNPISTDRTRPAAADDLMARPPVIVTVGRLCTQKDYTTLIWAFAMLRRTDVRLAVCGEGPERGSLEQLAGQLGVASRIDWRGYVREPWGAYAEARCFALSSRSESFGNVVVEALASGLPVVSTACGGPSEILEGGRYGRLVPIGDACALSLAMALTLEQPGDPAPRVARARQFAAPEITKRYNLMFEEVLSS
jgi:glycosyltransferase involved in cell wall biosynthesis